MNIVDVVLDNEQYKPYRAHKFDAGADLYSTIDVIIEPCRVVVIPTGVKINIPSGYVGLIFSRSGMGLKHVRMSNCVGVIDAGYQGEIGVALRNDSHVHEYEVKNGSRVAQLVIIQCLMPQFRVVNKFDESERGENGFGSTG